MLGEWSSICGVRHRLADALIPVALILGVVLLYRKVTRLWWTWDDAYLLHIAATHAVRDQFIDGSIWLSMPQQLFTPLLTASYGALLAAFGANPRPFYFVQLAEVALTGAALYLTLRLWLSRGAAACAAMVFLTGVPVCVMVSELMLMHYVESVLLAIVSVALFTLALRRGQVAWSVVSAVVYLAAMLAKEIAVPLLVLLALLPEGDWRNRVRRLWPHGAALAIYLVWRRAVLGRLVGGSGWVFEPADVPQLVGRTLVNMVRTFAGPALWIGIPLLIVMACGIALRLRSRRDVARIIIALVLAVAPIIPVAHKYEKRFSYVTWLCAAIVFASGIETLRNRRVAAALMIAAPALSLAVNRQEWSGEYRRAMRMSDEGRVFANIGVNDFLRKPSIPPGTMYQLHWLKKSLLLRGSGSLWFFDDLYLCRHERPGRVFGYDERSRTVVEITSQIDEIARRYCASIRDNAPLAAHFHFKRGVLRWELGPYDRGAYSVVVGDGFNAYDVGARDALQTVGLKSLVFRVRYASPEGWVTYSPELSLDFGREQDLSWRR